MREGEERYVESCRIFCLTDHTYTDIATKGIHPTHGTIQCAGLTGLQLLTSDLWREFEHKLLQQALLTVLEDGDLREIGRAHV